MAIDDQGHCLTTCQIHNDTKHQLERHETVIYGDDSDGGLIAKMNRVLDTLDTIKKLVYGLVGMALTGMVITLGKLILIH